MTLKKRRVLRWAGIAATVPAVALVLFIAYFVAAAEIAHDAARCPFSPVERRLVSSGIEVVDEARRCQTGVEEHRWVVQRGSEQREIGRRRLHQHLFDASRYSWRATIQDGFVHIAIENSGIEAATFREGPE